MAKKSEAAVSLGKRRWRGSSAAERSAHASAMVAARYADKPPVPCTVCGEPCRSVRAMHAHRKAAHNVARGPKPKAL